MSCSKKVKLCDLNLLGPLQMKIALLDYLGLQWKSVHVDPCTQMRKGARTQRTEHGHENWEAVIGRLNVLVV